MINLNQFISENVICRSSSMFIADIRKSENNLINKINGKSICVIGGAGSIGSAFIKTILPYHPSMLVVVDINENGLTELTRDLRSTKDLFVPKEYYTYPIDFSSSIFKKIFMKNKGFDIICNFSAHKHVRSEKNLYSIEALLRNNVFNTKYLMDLLSVYPPEMFFCVSTDKAANPTNIMGASKRIMEDIVFSYSDKFKVSTARFANVAFSNGSLLAGFLERINRLQPLSGPVDVKRYFVSPEESGHICLLACIEGNNREIFYPKLTEAQMKAFDSIGYKLLEYFGYEIINCSSEEEAFNTADKLKFGSNKYPVYFTKTDTSGEKMFEEFFTEDEISDVNKFNSLGVITDKKIPDKNKIISLLIELNEEFDKEETSKVRIVEILKNYLPNFNHIETGKSLDEKI